MDGIGGEISSKIRAAIKSKLMEMGAYVDEELPDYVMVMVANKRSKAQMAEDLQLFLGKSTEQFTNWLQQVLNKLQEVAIVNNKTLQDTKKVQSRASSSDEAAQKAKSASKLKCEQVAKPKPEHISERASSHRAGKQHAPAARTVDGGAAAGKDRRIGSGGGGASAEKTERAAGSKAPKAVSSKTKIILMNSDDEDEDGEDFLNIKADAEAEALLKAELPASARQLLSVVGAEAARKESRLLPEAAAPAERAAAEPRQLGASAAGAVAVRDVTAALAHSTSSTRKVRPTVRRVVTAPASTVTVASKRLAVGEDTGGPAKRAAVCTGELGSSKKSLASAVTVTDRLGVRQSAGPSIKDRLGTRPATVTAASSRLASRLGVRKPAAAEVGASGTSATGAGGRKMTDGSGGRPAGISDIPGAKSTASPEARALSRFAGRLGVSSASRKRPAEGGGCSSGTPEVAAKRPAVEDAGSRLAQRLRELAEGPSAGVARVAHVPPNNIRQGASVATSRAERRPSINSQVVPTGVRGKATESRDGEDETAPAVALPSVVRVTPRPRLPASLQANKNLLLKAVAEAQRSVAAAAATVTPLGAVRQRGGGWRGRSRLRLGPRLQEGEEDGDREEEEEEQQQQQQQGEEDDTNCGNEGEEAPQNSASKFTLGFLKRENFAVTVSNESGAAGDSDTDMVEAEEPSDGGRQHTHIPCELRGVGRRRLVVTTSGEPQESETFSAADVPQQITIRLSPEGSQDGDTSSEREDEEEAEMTSLSMLSKNDMRNYDGRSVLEDEFEEEEEEESPVATVAAVRPTVVTTVPHMDTEPVTRTNPQFVVTLDGVDVSKFPNAGIDDEECPVDLGRTVDGDLSKVDSGGGGTGSGAGQCTGAPATGRATVVQRVEPRLRLGPMPSQHRQDGVGESSSAGLSSGSSSTPAKTAERCKYWPACRLGGKCTFHHPTQACRVFPACKFGEKCLYIHPNCKFDAACTRRDCPYTHSSPRLSAAVAAAARGPAQAGSGAAVCRFFPGCTNPACRFLHPKACKYGRYCVKLGCTYQHDGVPTTDKLKWVCPFRA